MYNKLLETLLASSMRSILSEHEIEEIAIEINDDFQTIISEKIDEVKDEVIDDLTEKHKKEISDLKNEICELEKNEMMSIKIPHRNSFSLADQLTMEWVSENWDQMTKMSNLNIPAKKIMEKYSSFNTNESINSLGNVFKKESMDALHIEEIDMKFKHPNDPNATTIFETTVNAYSKSFELNLEPIDDHIIINSAMYGAGDNRIDITDKIIIGKKITNSLAGCDPAPKCAKTLMVNASIDGKIVDKIFNEGEKLMFDNI